MLKIMSSPFMNPLLRLVAAHPNLIATHAESYARMLSDEVAASSTALTRRVCVGGAALALLLIGFLLAGVGVMLWGTLPLVRVNTGWVLIAVPGVPLALSALFFIVLKSDSRPIGFTKIKAQFKADVAMLHETGAL
jgi:hypothetical protein